MSGVPTLGWFEGLGDRDFQIPDVTNSIRNVFEERDRLLCELKEAKKDAGISNLVSQEGIIISSGTLRTERDKAVAEVERLKLIANAARDVLAARDSGADDDELAAAWEDLSAARDVGTSRLLVLAAEREDFAEAVRSALRLIGSWREAVCLLEDFCSDPVRLKNMCVAVNSIDDWVNQTVALVSRYLGMDFGERGERCENCDGTGWIERAEGPKDTDVGVVRPLKCASCHGSGRVNVEDPPPPPPPKLDPGDLYDDVGKADDKLRCERDQLRTDLKEAMTALKKALGRFELASNRAMGWSTGGYSPDQIFVGSLVIQGKHEIRDFLKLLADRKGE